MYIYKYIRKPIRNNHLGKLAYAFDKDDYNSIGYEFVCTIPLADSIAIERKIINLNDIYRRYNVHKHL